MSTAPASTHNAGSELLDPGFMSRLEQLEIVSRRIFASRFKGERRSKRRGQSVEFADYRNYVVGDDLRFIDWNIYARLERLFLKVFLEEEDLNLSLLIDTSGSMDAGTPVTKAGYALRVAAALAYIGLCNMNRVNLFAYNAALAEQAAGLRARRSMQRVIQFLSSLPIGGGSHLTAAARRFALQHTQRGVVLVVSDFLDKHGFEEGLKYLIGRNLDVFVLQVLSPEEVEPQLAGDLRLVDVEDADVAEVTITRALLNRYRANLAAYCQSLRDYCTQRGASYLMTTTDVPFEQIVLNYFRQRGLVR